MIRPRWTVLLWICVVSSILWHANLATADEHPDVAEARQQTVRALELTASGDHASALSLAESALSLVEGALGRDHPTVAIALVTQASLLGRLERHSEALPVAERSLEIRERNFGLCSAWRGRAPGRRCRPSGGASRLETPLLLGPLCVDGELAVGTLRVSTDCPGATPPDPPSRGTTLPAQAGTDCCRRDRR